MIVTQWQGSGLRLKNVQVSRQRPISPYNVELVCISRDRAALRAHARRVAAVACEVGARLRIGEVWILEEAALLHHYPPEVLDYGTLGRLLDDVRDPGWSATAGGVSTPALSDSRVRAVLTALRDRQARAADRTSALFAEILELADFFTERLEFLPFEFETVEQVIDELGWMAKDGFYQPEVVAALASLPSVRIKELIENVHRLPVFPSVALQALEIVSSDDASFSQLERLVKSDQVLAGQVLKAANTLHYSPVRPISTIPQAITYIGLEACRKVLMAAAFQPLYASKDLHDLWKHSLAMADLAEHIASVCRGTEPAEAFLAGLVHDVGRLTFARLPRQDFLTYSRLLEKGCEPVFAELTLAGFEHGAAGAEVLRSWCFPAHLVEAVEHHHRPERTESALAALLYAAEHLTGASEDLISALRLGVVQGRLGVPIEALETGLRSRQGVLDLLASGL